MDREFLRDESSSSHAPSTHSHDPGQIGYLVPVHSQPFFQQPTTYPAYYEVPLTWQQVMGMQPMMRGDEAWEEGEYRQFFLPIPLPLPFPPRPFPPYPVYPPFGLYPPFGFHHPYPFPRPYPYFW